MSRAYFECYKAFLVLIAVFYFPGLVFYPFFSEAYAQYYNYSGGLYLNATFLLCVFLMLTLFCFYALDFIPVVRFPALSSNLIYYLIFILVIVFFLLSLNFSINFSSSFRHKNRLSNSGLVTLMFLIKPVIFYIISLLLIHILNGNSLGKRSRILLFLILASCILSLNSSLQFIVIPLVLVMLYSPQVLHFSLKSLKISTLFLMTFSLITVCCSVVFIGIGNKVGYKFLLSDEGFLYVINYGDRLFPRISSSLFSSVILFENYMNGISYTSQTLESFFTTTSNRFRLLLPGEGFDGDVINTINRLNYLEVFSSHAARAGASPGLLASIFYVPFFPFSIVFIPFYVALIFRSMKIHMEETIKFNIVSYIFFVYLLLNLFEAPLNIFYILDPIFILFFVVVFLGKFINIKSVFSR